MSAHAHEITDAVARELVSCFLRAFKRFENVWLSLSRTVLRTQARDIHICVRLSLSSMPGSLGAFFSDADSASLSAQYRFSQRNVDFKQNSAFMMMVSHW